MDYGRRFVVTVQDNGQSTGGGFLRNLGDTFGVGRQNQKRRFPEFVREQFGRKCAREAKVLKAHPVGLVRERWHHGAAPVPNEIRLLVAGGQPEEHLRVLGTLDSSAANYPTTNRVPPAC